MIFDTHAHYDDVKFDEDREVLLSSLEGAGIGRVVNIAVDLPTTKASIALAEKYDFIYATAGYHPSDIGGLTDEIFPELSSLTEHEKVVAVGEIGLDYYWVKDEKGRYDQRYWFRRQIDLARAVELPIVIHSREAAADTLRICKEEMIGDIGGVMHCFSYSKEIAREYLDMGIFLGIGGVLTYKNGRVLKEVAEYAPMEGIVLETDCPYLSPEPLRGKRNSSLNLLYVLKELARIKGMSEEEVTERTTENAKRLYKMKD